MEQEYKKNLLLIKNLNEVNIIISDLDQKIINKIKKNRLQFFQIKRDLMAAYGDYELIKKNLTKN